MKICNGVGLAALVLAIVGMLTPVVGLPIGYVALVTACIAALGGDRGLTIATVIVSAIAFVFFTPSLWMATAGRMTAEGGGAFGLVVLSVILLALPVIGIILNSTGKLVLYGK